MLAVVGNENWYGRKVMERSFQAKTAISGLYEVVFNARVAELAHWERHRVRAARLAHQKGLSKRGNTQLENVYNFMEYQS